jgi:hypothetical protein
LVANSFIIFDGVCKQWPAAKQHILSHAGKKVRRYLESKDREPPTIPVPVRNTDDGMVTNRDAIDDATRDEHCWHELNDLAWHKLAKFH